MRLMGLLYAVFGLMAFFCSLLPFAQFAQYGLTVSVAQMGGVLSLLYIVPLGLLVLGLLAFIHRLPAWRLWLLGGALLGLALAGWAASVSLEQLARTAVTFQLDARAQPVLAKGAYLSLLSYAALVLLALLPGRRGR